MKQEIIQIPYGKISKESHPGKREYMLIPLRGEASFLFPAFSIQEGGIEYEVKRLIPLQEWPEEKTEQEEILQAVESIKMVRHHLDEYLLAEGNISWRPEHVFWNDFQKEIRVLFVPDGNGGTLEEFWKSWTRGILDKIVSQKWKNTERIGWILRLCQRIWNGEEMEGLAEEIAMPEISEVTDLAEIRWEQPIPPEEKRKKRFLSLPRP